ncbi:hypothetical protein GYMLUDRAFT_106005, partial [Collybiopsis luxurians FD-317 M1]
PDTTAIILNWDRFFNVVRIVTLMCTELQDTIAIVHVWNNRNITHISKEDFPQCPENRLKITNSAANLYFQARFLACEQASTPFCFIQDDDYLVLPEIIRSLRLRFSEQSTSAIFLLPSHEALSSDLRRIHIDSKIHTSFAWLGHGAIMKRSQAHDFLELLRRLEVSEEEMKMADNYYALLANVYPEIWFDQGIELAGGQAFTQGVEGDERNNRHITRAASYLDQIMNCDYPREDIPFITREKQAVPLVHKAPCLGSSCVLETTISLLPPTPLDTKSASLVLEIEKVNRQFLTPNVTKDYLLHPLSHAVDGNPRTGFCASRGVKNGDILGIDLLASVRSKEEAMEVALLVDRDAQTIFLTGPSLEFLVGNRW